MDDPIEAPMAEPPDVMNDPAYAPPARQDTAGSEGGGGETCRICRSEGTPDEPLFYPCKCNGSIKFVHQECLMEWLSHSHKKHCELCKTPFRFTKLYDANMPKTLPWTVFVRRACIHVATLFLKACRAALVGSVWLIMLPWMIRWSWRWMFWFADAGWARDSFLREMQAQTAAQAAGEVDGSNATTSVSDSLYMAFENIWETRFGRTAAGAVTNNTMDMITGALTSALNNATSTSNSTASTPLALNQDTSILSSWTYLSKLTPNPTTNRVILDVFEGQLITCVVITGFILVFLIREWVVQQQPLVNLDALNHDQRERDRLERETERLRQQVELLNQARARLVTLQEEAQNADENRDEAAADDSSIAGEEFIGWEQLGDRLDEATALLRLPDREQNMERFRAVAHDVVRQMRIAERTGVSVTELVENVYQKLSSFSEDERMDWEDILIGTLEQLHSRKGLRSSPPAQEGLGSAAETGESGDDTQPDQRQEIPVPPRDVSSLTARPTASSDNASTRAVFGGHDESDPGHWTDTDGSSQHESAESESIVDHVDIFQDNNDEMPITNAGPDAKVNIGRSGKSNIRPIVPEPDANPPDQQIARISDQELIRRLDARTGEASSLPSNAQAAPVPASPLAEHDAEQNPHANNPFHPDGPEPDEPEPESLRDRVASVFREEFGLDEAEDLEQLRQAGLGPDGENVAENRNVPDIVRNPGPDDPPASVLQRLAEYFWGDIQQPNAPEPAIAAVEERVGDDDNAREAPFVPIENGVPAIGEVPHNDAPPPNDPEVVAAAAQAGLDAEAIEDAEDLEGIFELIGFQGPLVGLLQTSCFCTVLVTGTVGGAVGLPYVWGKLILSFISAPTTLLVKLPLKLASSFADIVIDIGLTAGGWLLYFAARGNAIVLTWIGTYVPRMGSYGVSLWICKVAESTATHASNRLYDVFASSAEPVEGFQRSWNWAFLSGSIHAHASLKNIQYGIDSALNYTGHRITDVAEALSSGSFSVVWTSCTNALWQMTDVPVKLVAGVTALGQYTKPILAVFSSLKSGALTFSSAKVHMDPTLVYWNTTDRGLAVLTGYLSLAVIAAIYVAVDTPITSSQAGQRTEKMIRDTLRQAGGVLKVILIISIEMLAFPLYCGLLLDFAFLPLFESDSVATRWAFAVRAPSTFCFIHWFIGTCYMFHFALFVGMCRKILRKGVLWFIRDPDDPTFHPVRDVLERNVTTQLRKIAFSALVYGALVILCLGGVIWSIGRIFKGIFPIQWISTEPVLEFPMDLLLYNFLTPLLIRLFKPSDAVNKMYAWWLRRCARVLRLSHFLFDDRRKDEEGRHVRKSWASFLLLKKAEVEGGAVSANRLITQHGEVPEVYFKRDGKYVLTPCNDQYRPPKPGEAFLHSDDNDVYIADKEGRKNDHFAKIYVPPFFRLRVTLFMVCLWMFSAFMGLGATLVPLVFGRQIFASLLPPDVQVNDIYAYSLGAYIIAAVAFLLFKGNSAARYLREKSQAVSIKSWARSTTRYTAQALRCVYVYGFLGVVLPVVFAMCLQLYLIIPLHTYMVSRLGPKFIASRYGALLDFNTTSSPGTTWAGFADGSNGTAAVNVSLAQSITNFAANLTSTAEANATASQADRVMVLADHSIHILMDYAMGLLYVRIAVRLILTAPTSRAAQAFRRITANGYLNPDARLATRYLVLPTTLLSMIILLAPLWLAKMMITAVDIVNERFSSAFAWELSEEIRVLVYRYSYPVVMGLVMLVAAFAETGRVLARWRASVRDEVYLVGERLHNFGEGKPPVGSRSVVRKDK